MALESILLRYISLWNFHSEDGLFFPFLKIPFKLTKTMSFGFKFFYLTPLGVIKQPSLYRTEIFPDLKGERFV